MSQYKSRNSSKQNVSNIVLVIIFFHYDKFKYIQCHFSLFYKTFAKMYHFAVILMHAFPMLCDYILCLSSFCLKVQIMGTYVQCTDLSTSRVACMLEDIRSCTKPSCVGLSVCHHLTPGRKEEKDLM